jgi:hypothetical protein
MDEVNQRQAQIANMQSSFLNGDFKSGYAIISR